MAKVQNRDRLLQKLAALPQKARAAIKPAIEQGAAEIVAMQKNLVPKDSGALERSIEAVKGNVNRKVGLSTGDVQGDPDLTISIVAGNEEAWYARIVEFGSAPHQIVPKKAKVLKIGNRFATKASHPGAKATPFFYPAFRALRRRVKSRITRATRKAAREVASS